MSPCSPCSQAFILQAHLTDFYQIIQFCIQSNFNTTYVVINDPRHTECSNLTDAIRNTYAIMKTVCRPGYHQNALWQCTWTHDIWFIM